MSLSQVRPGRTCVISWRLKRMVGVDNPRLKKLAEVKASLSL